jgi:hypothetical protein
VQFAKNRAFGWATAFSYAFDEDLGYLFTIFQKKTFNLFFRGCAAGAGQEA